MRDFRRLKVWEKAHVLVLDIYQASQSFPKSEAFGLTSQVRRAAASVPANIAEGCGREGDAEFGRFLQIALGSACEVEYHLLLAHDLGLLSPEVYQPLDEQVTEVKKMLTVLVQRTRAQKSRD